MNDVPNVDRSRENVLKSMSSRDRIVFGLVYVGDCIRELTDKIEGAK